MKTRWFQYIKIFGQKIKKGKEPHNLIFSSNKPPREFPPKDRSFFVYCVKRSDSETDHVHAIGKHRSVIKGRGRETIWVGQAEWNGERNRYEVRTNSENADERKLSFDSLPEGILWSYDLPLNLISKR
jgi:hypothetical protein